MRTLILVLLLSFAQWGATAAEAPPAVVQPARAPVENRDQPSAEDQNAPAAAPTAEWTRMKAHDRNNPGLTAAGTHNQAAGTLIRVGGRIMDMTLARQGKFLVVKANTHIIVVDAHSFEIIEQVLFPKDADGKPDRGSMHGIATSPDGNRFYFTGNKRFLYQAALEPTGRMEFGPAIPLAEAKQPGNPLGVAITPDGGRAVVALSLANEVAVVELASGAVTARVPVGVCPYAVAVSRDGATALVSNYGGPRARPDDRTETVAGTKVAVDERSVALRGSVSVIDLATASVTAEIATGIHPEAMALSADGARLHVVDSSGDAISVIDVAARKVVGQLGTKPAAELPYGSLTNGVALANGTIFAANAGNNAVAMISPDQPATPFAMIPAGGYPGAIAVCGKDLFIGNIHGNQGNLQKVTVPAAPAELEKLTAAARLGSRLPEILRAQARAQTGAPPRPVPARVGEPSPIRHVVFIIKENKKFDQLLGDIGRGNAKPEFCEFPRATTPNSHALADRFVLLDNYYCSGVLSSDGHQWTVQGLTTPYREKDWSNGRSPYEFGKDPLSYAGCGFIWDHLLRKGLSFRNFGELGEAAIPQQKEWKDYHAAWAKRAPGPGFTNNYQIETLRRYSDMRYPGWQMAIPDQVRAEVFLTALAEFERAGSMPEFTIVYLPNDHTVHGRPGWPTPRARVADNDLALGRVVEALSHSRFWKDMATFSIQDDPQTGVDHVDGHRSVCFIASPYAKRGGTVVDCFYNQSSVLHTICRIFGVEPMNQLVALAPVMSECFQDEPDFTPYVCLKPDVPLDETNPDPKKLPGTTQGTLAPETYAMDFSKPDRIDDDALVFSRWVWSTVRGEERFPVEYFGAHGKGLQALGLRLDPNVRDDDDD